MAPVRHCAWMLVFVVVSVALDGNALRAAPLLVENAETGGANVTGHTTGGYPLIQSAVAAQGSNAFHLANPGLADNWFEINQEVTPQADTKLFFQSRLGWATTTQVARVQASNNGGGSWGINLFSQSGTGGAGEGAFSLKTIDLSPYANQSLRFRFYYDFVSGSAFTQTDAGVGWYVDDIQFADQFQKQQYSIGNPSADAQLYLEYLNRARANALTEATRLSNETDPNITSAYNYFGIDRADIVSQFKWYATRDPSQFGVTTQPLAFNAKLNQAAEAHSQDMLNNAFQGHQSSANPPAPFAAFGSVQSRMNTVGYTGGWGENVYSYAESPREGHAAFDVDWGDSTLVGDFYNPAFNGQGMQNQAGHRLNMHNPDFKEIGIGVVNGSNGPVGPQLVTQDFGDPGDATFVTGVVFTDMNNNNFYDIGEGKGGVRIDVDGSAYFAISTASGGYAVPVSGNGMKNITFSGGGFATYQTTATIVSGLNAKVDYLTSTAEFLAADFDENGFVNRFDFLKWTGDFGSNPNSDADGDNDSDGKDFLIWQQQTGMSSAVGAAEAAPEPTTAMGLVLAVVGLSGRLRRRHAA